jgi:hypothetical protein
MLSSYNFLIGYGLDSFNHFRSENYPNEFIEFDHGGSDILKILSQFGVIGSFIFLYIMIKLSVKRNIELDLFGFLLVLFIMTKGHGVFSSLGTLIIYYLSATKTTYIKK